MKKTLFLLMLLPFIGFSQQYLVRWKGVQVNWAPSANPTYYVSNISTDPITGVGINFSSGWNGFEGTGWTSDANGPDLTKYFLLKLSPNQGYKIDLTKLDLRYKGGCKKMRVSYSKDANFTNPTISTSNGLTSNNNDTDISIDLSGTNATIYYGETLYVRIYGYQNTGSTWALMNGQGNSDIGPAFYGTVSTYVTGAPAATNDTASTMQNSAVTIPVLSNDTTGTTAITSITTTTPAHGSVTVNGTTNVTYTPANGYSGTDTFNYTITNSSGSSTATVTVTVNPFVAPTAVNDTKTTLESTATTISVLANDTMGSSSVIASISTTTPAHGTVAVNSTASPVTVTYTPTTGYSGTDTFNYTITDGNGKTATATVTVTITAFTPPTAVNDTKTTIENSATTISVLANDTMGSSTVVSSVTISTLPTHGTAVVNTSESPITVTYTPTTSYSGTDTFYYTITDGNGKTGTAKVTVTITPFTPPTAVNDTATTGQNIPVTTNVLSNDTAGSGTITTVQITGAPASGTATVNANNTITYTPTAAFTGTATITYKVNDSNGKFGTATLTVTVQAIVAPTAANDTATTAKNTSVTINVIANDTAGNSPISTIAITTNPTHGSVTVNADKTLTYIPDTNYTGADTFKYTITNGYNASATGTVSVGVLPPSVTGALCGTYYIGTYGDFTTITAAVSHLNQYGVQCAVTFVLSNTVYSNATGETFPITVNTIPGSSLQNTVTFKPDAGVNVSIEASNVQSWIVVPSVFKMVGTDNIIIEGSNSGTATRNLTFYNKDQIVNGAPRSVIWIASTGSNPATNITIRNTRVRMQVKNDGSSLCTGIFAGNNNTNSYSPAAATAQNTNFNFTNDDFMNVKEGIYIFGGTTAATATTNVIIHQNDLGSENNTESVIMPVALKNVNTFEVTENYIYNLYRDSDAGGLTSAGILVDGISKNGSILRNDLKEIKRTADNSGIAGIHLASTEALSNITVANNFILNVSGNGNNPDQSCYGIRINSGGGYKINYNTVNLITPPMGGYSACFYVAQNVTGLDVRNNIFANNQASGGTRRCAVLFNTSVSNIGTMFSNLDYNAYYSTDKIGYIGTGSSDSNNAGYITLFSNWKSTTGKDAHTQEVSPVFLSASDLHINPTNNVNALLSDKGTPLTAVTKDIDQQVRNTTTPDIGADEFGTITVPDTGGNAGVYCTSSTTYTSTGWSNGTPTLEKDVVFESNYTQTGGALNACSIIVKAGVAVNFTSNATANVKHNVTVITGGSVTFESNSNLYQYENDQNSGTVIIKRKGSMLKRQDYAIWSSPVTGTQKLTEFSPLTLVNRFYTFSAVDNTFAFVTNPEATTFGQGKGYLIRMPNSLPSIPGYNAGTATAVFEGQFPGTPNNGTIRTPMAYNGTSSYNMVGNPYPSPISIHDFIDDNIDNIQGTIWLWRKTNNTLQTSYWAINKTGATVNAAPGGTNGLVEGVSSFNNYATSLLNTGQGFFVNAKRADNLIFRNSMRRTTNLNTFFKENESTEEAASSPLDAYKGRVWLSVRNTEDFAQTLIGYNPINTLGYDEGYDGKTLADGSVSIYTLLEDATTLSIQGRPAFDKADTVKLGYKAATAGQLEIMLDDKDGIFAGDQDIYLKDLVTGAFHDLKTGSYTFTSDQGTFDDRFRVVYATDEELGTTTPQVPLSNVIVYRNNRNISIKSPVQIEQVTVYDMLGKIIYSNNNVGAQEFSTTDIMAAQQVVIVRVILDNNQVVSKKIIMN
jgi:hypothetical protein